MRKEIDPYRIAELIFLDEKGELNDDELHTLHEWINESAENQKLYHRIRDKENIENKIRALKKVDKKAAWKKLSVKLDERESVKRVHFRDVLKYAAAIVILLAVAVYLLIKPDAYSENEKIAETPVIHSGTQKAILTTSDNKKIELGVNEKRRIYDLGSTIVTDTNYTLTCLKEKTEPDTESTAAYNTLTTPRGGEYKLVLPDGTWVYLNAETSLTFPEVFLEESREVVLEGEAYFEVTGSKTKPFIVNTPDLSIRVYGTSFNVSAYTSDPVCHTTLVEGSLGVNRKNEEPLRMRPGEQVNFSKKDSSMVIREVDTDAYTSWKDGKFVFNNETLGSIMRKLERWYDVETRYAEEEIMQYHFSGTLDRYDDISGILEMITITSKVEFNIRENVIIISKK